LRTKARCALQVSTVDLDAASLIERGQATPGMAGADLARTVSTEAPYDAGDLSAPRRPTSGRSGGSRPTTSA
jgi:hypothetical protein